MRNRIFMIDDSLAEPIFLREAIVQATLDVELEAFNESVIALQELKTREENNKFKLPHLILLDINMPGDSGIDILHKLKNEGRLRLIPVVVLTSSNLLKDIEDSIDAGARSIIVKPTNIEDYKNMITNVYKYWFETIKVNRVV
ncbi:MAG: response regulator [Bacteroidetes bacterium]|nr:response regulator [Bacteroidota bacterium]